MIRVENVSMKFRMNGDNIQSLKEFAIALAKKKVSYKDFWVFRDINFEVKKGEVVGIIGRNGAGKSTLLKIISGILAPTEGKVTLNGKVVPMLELGSGFDYELTGRENIFLNGSILGYSEEFLNSKYDEILEFSELGEFIETPIRNYSSGMMMRLAFSIATIVQPEILIVDEILAVGDEAFQRKSKRKMLELMGGGTTVLFVSHSIDQIREMCNRVIWIEKGQMKMQGDTKMVCDEYQKYINPVQDAGDKKHKSSDAPKNLSDVLFIYGDDEYMYEWRVTYQREQFLAGAVATNEIYYKDLTLSVAKLYRAYIFVNCCNTPELCEFIEKVKYWNKTVIFDFSMCGEDLQDKGQEELFYQNRKFCDAIIVSNRILYERYKDSGVKIVYNPLTVDLKMLEYANWATYDRDILLTKNTKYMTDEELINYNRYLAVYKKRMEDGARIAYCGADLKKVQMRELRELLVSMLDGNQKRTLILFGNETDLCEELKPYISKIVFKKRIDREDIFRVYAETDVVLMAAEDLAMEQDHVLAEWICAALVKVPMFVYAAHNRFNSDTQYHVYDDLNTLKGDLQKRLENLTECRLIGKDYYNKAKNNCTSLYTGSLFTREIRELFSHNIVFAITDNNIGGNNWVACQHAALMRREGWDVSIFATGKESKDITFDGVTLPVLSRDLVYSFQYMEQIVAVDTPSVMWMQNYTNVGKRYYIAQGFETQNYNDGNIMQVVANQIYTPHTDVKYIVLSGKQQEWLRETFCQNAYLFPRIIGKIEKREKNGKKKIAVVGNVENMSDNLDAAFEILAHLDKNEFETVFLCFGRKPYEYYEADMIYENPDQETIYQILAECDILLHTSLQSNYVEISHLMMAVEGINVIMNHANMDDSLQDGINCICFEGGNWECAVACVQQLIHDSERKRKIISGGLLTAENIMEQAGTQLIVDFYTTEWSK